MKKEFESPYHALGSQTAALVQLIDALRNAQENDLHFSIDYHLGAGGFNVVKRFVVRADPLDLCDCDVDKIAIPDVLEWDISHMFQSKMLGESDRLLFYMRESREGDEN